MRAREILFVTKVADSPENGLSYALYLAGALGRDLRIILVREKPLSKRFDDFMTAVTFAEANEHGSALQHVKPVEGEIEAVVSLLQLSSQAGIKTLVHPGMSDAFASVKDFLARRTCFDMVILSHSLSQEKGTLKRMVNISSLPVVALAS